MSTLIHNRSTATDRYLALADDQALPAGGAVLVSLQRWQTEAAALASRAEPFGVRLPNSVDVEALEPALLRGARLIALEFPAFADGRAYSQARRLRDALGYAGEIRATGAAVVQDQIQSMARCGFDSFEIRDDQSIDACLTALHALTLAYQGGRDDLPRVRALRRGAGAN